MPVTRRGMLRARLGGHRRRQLDAVHRSRALRGADVVLEQPAEPLATDDRGVVVDRLCLRNDQVVVETLVVAFEMIVLDELRNCRS